MSAPAVQRSHLDHFYFILDHLHVRWGAVARRHNLLSRDLCPDHYQQKKEKEKKPRQKGGLRLIEMPNKYKIQDNNLIYISETVENILNHACMINKLEA